MINDKGIVKVSPDIEFINDWRDHNGQYQIDRYVSSGRVIINKMVTGCGFTTYCLRNDYDADLQALQPDDIYPFRFLDLKVKGE